jgi:superfamily II DNA helicase RecQ
MDDKVLNILKQRFGHEGFKSNEQYLTIDNVLKNKDTLYLAPTGGGKSLVFDVFRKLNHK